MLYQAQAATSSTTIALGVIGVLLTIPVVVFFLRSAWRMFQFVRAGQAVESGTRFNRPWRRLGTMLIEIFGHTKMLKHPVLGVMHWLVMVGFLFGIIVYAESFIQVFNPAGGWPWLSTWSVYHVVEEVLAVGTIVGILAFIFFRIYKGSSDRDSRFYFSNMTAARVIEAIVLIEGLGMLLVKAGKISAFGAEAIWPNFISYWIAQVLPASPELVSIFAFLKLISGLAFLLFLSRYLAWGVGWHRFTAFFNIFFQRDPAGEDANGKLKPMVSNGEQVTIDTVEDEDKLGVGSLEDASWKMLLDTTACTECGRCQDLCPAWNTGKPLSPKKLIMDIRDAALSNASYLMDPTATEPQNDHAGIDVLKMAGEGGLIDDDVLWSCTNCGACVDQCPVDIEHIDHIADLRRFQVLADSDFPSELTGMFTNIENKGNPWGRNNSERGDWVEEARTAGVEVPVFGEDVENFDDIEYLFWVGCAGAYDEDGKRTSRAVVELLDTAGVKFAVLSKGESCTGDPARRAGNEFLFQMQAMKNIETLDEVFDGVDEGRRKIITTCPHCFNTIRNEYPDFDGHYDVFHHTQLLNRLVRDKRITPVPRTAENRKPITYHDPCFLGRHNKVYDPPRELVTATGMQLNEMDYSREDAFCCGAGGARMFMEENQGQRVNEFRTEQALATGAEEIAVGCPFCNTMFTGGVKAVTQDQEGPKPQVKDVAVMLRDSVLIDGALPDRADKHHVAHPTRLDLGLTPKRKDVQAGDIAVQPPASKESDTQDAASGPAGSAPAAPAVPGAPVAPSAPSSPQAPGAPGVPPAPAAGVPSAPAAPGAGAPPAPSAPAAPTTPTPTPPAAPSAAPAAPSAPSAPSAPAAPSVPGAPTPPAAPSAGVPAAPSAPGAPGSSAPSTPAAPGAPTPPAAPSADAPSAPAAPSAPSAPATPTPPPAPSANAPTPPAPPSAPSAPAASTPPPVPSAGAPSAPSAPTPPAAPGANAPSAPTAPAAPPAPGAPSAPAAPPAPTPPAAPPAPPASAPKPSEDDSMDEEKSEE